MVTTLPRPGDRVCRRVYWLPYYYSTFDSHIVCAFPAASELVELVWLVEAVGVTE